MQVSSQVRFLHNQTVLEDNRKLCDYPLPEGAVISALFEPDVDINVEVNYGLEVHRLTVTNAASVKTLKVQMSDVMKFGKALEKLEIRLGDIKLEDPMPLHFYGIKDGVTLNIHKPYISVTIENNQGATLFWRVYRKDTIREVKAKLATVKWKSKIRFHSCNTSTKPSKERQSSGSGFDEIRGLDEERSVEGMRLYLMSEEKGFSE